MKAIFTLFLVLFCLKSVVAQSVLSDSLLFLNGKTLQGEILEVTKEGVRFKTFKEKEILIENYRLFSMNWNGLDSTIFQRHLEEYNLSVNEMKFYVYGKRDARNNYTPVFSNSVGFVGGATAGYFMEKEQSFILVATPFVYVLSTLVFSTRVKKSKSTNIQYLREENYLYGYDSVARSKRTQGAIKSTIIGMGIGFIASLIAN